MEEKIQIQIYLILVLDPFKLLTGLKVREPKGNKVLMEFTFQKMREYRHSEILINIGGKTTSTLASFKSFPLFINSSFEQRFIEDLLCFRYCPRPWDTSGQGRFGHLEADHQLGR